MAEKKNKPAPDTPPAPQAASLNLGTLETQPTVKRKAEVTTLDDGTVRTDY